MDNTSGRPPRTAQAAGWFSTLLIVIGVFILLTAVGLQAYTIFAERRWESDQKALMTQFLAAPAQNAAVLPKDSATATPSSTATAAPSPTPTSVSAPVAALPPVGTPDTASPTVQPSPTAQPSSTATPTPAPTRTPTHTPVPPTPSDPGRLIIPKLNLDTPIVVIKLANGSWNIDKLVYDVGLLGGTGFPGWPGNAAITGHVTLLRYGNGPLRWLEKLADGDDIYVQQGERRFPFKVVSTRTVLPNDVSVLAPSEDTRLTLITCTGWDYLKADYTHRLVVTAVLDDQQSAAGVSQ